MIEEENKKNDEISFESKIEEAKKLLEKLIDPNITLSNSVEEYKKGMNELEMAQKLLDDAKLNFQQLNKENL